MADLFPGASLPVQPSRFNDSISVKQPQGWSTLQIPTSKVKEGTFIRKDLECIGASLFFCSVGRKYGFWPFAWHLASRLAQLQKKGDLRLTGSALT
jgi:hypothetical protein